MSTALWYYCNEQNEASRAIPVVQRLQNAVQDDLKTSVVRREPQLVVGVEENDELAVGRSTYVLAAVFNAISDMTSAVVEQEEIKKDLVAATEPVKVAVKPDVVEEPVVVVKVEEEMTPIVSKEETTDAVVEKKIDEPVVVHEESVKTEVDEPVAVVETVKDAVELVAVVEEDILDSVVAQASVEEESAETEAEQPVSEPVVLEETVEKETTKDEALPEAPAVQSDIPVVDKTEDVMLDVDPEPRKLVTRMPSIPEDTESVHDEIPENEDVVEEEQEAPASEKPIADYESETETQSEISEAPVIEAVEPVAIAKIEDEPESEIEETMIIDPIVAAKEAAVVEKQTSAYSFIPEQIRNNSYAVSSVAVAVTTAIVATLVARR
ncbi:Zonadhesin [Phytophthora citrophthora]|uniref:Zonadhesin n=1 Tax=Phytophthora citrophthora TaxID=4793 RepID=A0AAD9G0U1_9STRA|nr:Zonadhesin [Phytophthora citrophthora]